MNEAGVFGRFVPDFGRVVARMQFDMYHHYTVDEHTIRAIGLLARIEQGALKEDHPLATALFKRIASRRLLYVAVLLHDIAKGRGGDHSVLGAEVARTLCPRLGLDEAETADRRLARPEPPSDVGDRLQARSGRPQGDPGFRRAGEEPGAAAAALPAHRRRYPRGRAGGLERLEGAIAQDPVRGGRGGAPARPQAKGAQRAGGGAQGGGRHAAGLGRGPFRRLRRCVARQLLARRDGGGDRRQCAGWSSAAEARAMSSCASSPIAARRSAIVHAEDRPGLFYRLAAAISLAGGNIIDARIHTSGGGMALDNFLIQDQAGAAFAEPHQLKRLEGGDRRRSGRRGAAPGPARRARAARCAGPKPSRSAPPSSSMTRRRAAIRWSRSTLRIAPPCSATWRWRSPNPRRRSAAPISPLMASAPSTFSI